jgi:hypothetical protein
MTYLGIFTPVIGVVRFWPAVIVPAVFTTLFGPLVGGTGAAIGIFASDLLIHGDPLLSITIGVPSNFIGFYILGFLARKKFSLRATLGGILVSIAFAASSAILLVFAPNYLGESASLTLLGISFFCAILSIGVFLTFPNWGSYTLGSIIGLGAGSIWIGLGVWVFSKFFVLASTGEVNMPLYAALGWFLWTYFTEIPFLILVVPPILAACYIAFPSLKPRKIAEAPFTNA